MSIPSVQGENCCCIRFNHKAIRQYHWLEVAALITAAVSILLACLAFSQAGAFAQSSFAIPFGYSFLALAGILSGIEFIYKLFLCCYSEKKELTPGADLSSKKEDSPIDTAPALKKSAALPEIPLKERLKPPFNQDPIPANAIKYSPKRDPEEKMDLQLDFAVREGLANKKKNENAAFAVDMESDVSAYIKNISPFEWGGATEAIGYKDEMEDASLITSLFIKGQRAHLVGIFDGHEDKGLSANYLKQNLPQLISEALSDVNSLNAEDLGDAMTKICLEVDGYLQSTTGGTMAVWVLVLENKIICVNVGDSRFCLIRKDVAYQLNETASLENARFKKGIEKMNLPIVYKGGAYRIYGMLAAGRDLGSGILSRPKMTCIEKGIEDDLEKMKIGYQKGDYLVGGSDGLWDVATVQEVAEAVRLMDEAGMMPNEMSARLAEAAQKAKTLDNISVAVVKL
jgi:serine/threonine protein phosphatase PrpC